MNSAPCTTAAGGGELLEPSEMLHAERPPVLASAELLRGGRLVEIHHHGEIYRLQCTRLGKLILTK